MLLVDAAASILLFVLFPHASGICVCVVGRPLFRSLSRLRDCYYYDASLPSILPPSSLAAAAQLRSSRQIDQAGSFERSRKHFWYLADFLRRYLVLLLHGHL